MAEEDQTGSDTQVAAAVPSGETTDQTLNCVQCGAQFVFTTDEQKFFAERGFHAPPKRCKNCRAERRKSRKPKGGRGRMSEYRGPAFREKRDSQNVYRSPAFKGRTDGEGVYRSPAFRERDGENVEDIYRSPAFQEEISEIYRGPAFQQPLFTDEDEGQEPATPDVGEVDLEQGPPPGYREPRSPEEIYRGPAFADTDPAGYAPSYRRRQMYDVVCADCGRKTRIPFQPKSDRPVYCKECYAKKSR
jgi:CxxC-x17-CxxC domain-containing protein